MTTINNLSIEQMREIVSKAPANAESYQGGYYFRESPQFMFHNGFHDQWNLTDNDGLYFRAAGFHPVRIDDLRTAIASHEPKMHSHLTSDALQSDDIAKHDEFKVGDLVVCTNRGFNEVDKIREFDSDGYFTTVNGYYCNPRVFRHATPSEIKAGHRIDSKQCQHGYDIACLICGFGTENGVRVWRNQIESDDFTDIRNHLSPSTRVVDL